METSRLAKTSLALSIVILFGALVVGLAYVNRAQASAPIGLASTVATTSNPSVTNTAALVFATSTNNICASRVITTYASPIMITFSDNQGKTPTGSFGFLQPASTTVVYDGGQYGCQAVRIYSFATQSITVMETR